MEPAYCKRMTTFHETFAPAGSSSASKPVISAVWHKAVAGHSFMAADAFHTAVERSIEWNLGAAKHWGVRGMSLTHWIRHKQDQLCTLCLSPLFKFSGISH